MTRIRSSTYGDRRTLTFRLLPVLHPLLLASCDKERITLNAYIIRALKQALSTGEIDSLPADHVTAYGQSEWIWLTLRLDPALANDIAEAAARNGISRNQLINAILIRPLLD